MKQVLVITYYWPPSGGAGVQRWLKFTKYFPEFGWKPVVYTPENPEAPVDDPTLLNDIDPAVKVIKRPIWEPYSIYKRFMGMTPDDPINAGFLSEKEKPPKKEGLSVWIRGNLFIPDARKFWVAPSVRFLMNYLADNPVEAIISTGPPHSMHLIALKLKQQTGISWIADFRDPWTDIDFYDQLRLTRRSDRRHRLMEETVLKQADHVVVVGKTMGEKFRESTGIQPEVIPNGYDEPDFLESGDPPDSNKFSIIHVGAMNRDRNHPVFWKALSDLARELPGLAGRLMIQLVGKLDHSVLQSLKTHGLEEKTVLKPYMDHRHIPVLLKSASVLYLPINRTPNARSIQTGKIFEYLAAGRPILGTGPVDGDAASTLRECRAGIMLDFDDLEGVKNTIREWYALYLDDRLHLDSRGTEAYTRKNLAGKYARILQSVSRSAG
jgi:glycosyltransferase involved in cell wall biosynthesis